PYDAPFFFSSRRRHTRFSRDWSSDVCSSDLGHFAWHRIRSGPKSGPELGRMVATSAVIPPVAVAHRLLGTLRYRNVAPQRWVQRSEERRVGTVERTWLLTATYNLQLTESRRR